MRNHGLSLFYIAISVNAITILINKSCLYKLCFKLDDKGSKGCF